MTNTLEDQFQKFLSFLPGSENIDSLAIPKGGENSQKADYFLAKRQIIIEIKSLKKDTSHKVEKIIEPHRERSEFPNFYGERDLQDVLTHLPDGEEIKKTIYEKITTSIEKAFKKADDQITETKNLFNVPYAQGVLVILNESIDIFSPDVLLHKVAHLLNKKNSKGEVRYQAIVCAWIIFESHYIQINPNLKAPLIVLLTGPQSKDHPELADFIDEIQPKWAEFNKVPFLSTDAETFESLEIESFAKDREKKRNPIGRH